MGNYNPDAPFVLGNEFAGIKDFDLEFSYNNNAAEYGVGFTLPGSTTLTDARVYSHPYDPANNILSPNQAANTPLLVSVYPAGKQYDSGPIRRVIIPVTGGQVTGSGSTSSAGNVVYNGGTVNVPGTPPTNAHVANAVFDDGTGLQMLTPRVTPHRSGPTRRISGSAPISMRSFSRVSEFWRSTSSSRSTRPPELTPSRRNTPATSRSA